VLDTDDGYNIQRIGFAYHLCVTPLAKAGNIAASSDSSRQFGRSPIRATQ
jgi:hypothetical protein